MPKRFLPFGDLKRDGPDYDNASLNEARNVLPVYGVYRPVRKLQEVSSSDTITNFSFTPWLDFAGTDATSKVDFTVNPLPVDPITRFTLGLRFRTDTPHTGLICGAGLPGLTNAQTGFGWAIGTEAEGGFVRAAVGPGDASGTEEIVFSRVQLPGGYDDDDWHVLRFDFVYFVPPIAGAFIRITADGILGDPADTGETQIDATDWGALSMRWGRGTLDAQRFQGDLERVLMWDDVLGDPEFTEDMNSPLDGLSPGGWNKAPYAYPIRENTGTTVVNYGTAL